MTYRVVHRTEYRYDSTVSASYGEAHLHPRETPSQQCYASTLTIDPYPESFRERRDFHGNRAAYFSIREPHRELVVTATSEVEVMDRSRIVGAVGDRRWERVTQATAEDPAIDTRLARELVLPSPAAPRSAVAAEYAEPSFPAGRPLVEALAELAHRLHDDFEFAPGVTTVTSTIEEVMARRAGVCQDFAHLAIAGLRPLGLATRYVSGYLETEPPPGLPHLVGVDQSHAWVSVYVPEVGWVDLDPTNDQFANDRYVTVAWGRDYSDVPPLKGVIFTPGESQQLSVHVDVVRMSDNGSFDDTAVDAGTTD
jgi:transglutaminase-like putative cysteine protease